VVRRGSTAFSLIYPGVLEWRLRGGEELSFFSPLVDEPPDASGRSEIYLRAGFPESMPELSPPTRDV